MPGKTDTNRTPADTSRFATTHWSVVLAAGDHSSPQHEKALGSLCKAYWFPLYAYLRRSGYNAHQAEDYTQAFFAQMLAKRYLSKVNPRPGKFRSFLLATLRHFVADEHDRARAVKRGGGLEKSSFDFEAAENRYAIAITHDLSPDKIFERSWALAILEKTMSQLEAELAARKKQTLFDALRVHLGGQAPNVPYRKIGAEMHMTEGAVKVAVHRLRGRYKELLREEIAQTVAAEDQIDEEIRDLFVALAC